jgi:hypothetical protein
MSRLNQICRALALLLVLLPLTFEMIDRVFGEVALFAPLSLTMVSLVSLGSIWIYLLCWASQAQRKEEEARMEADADAESTVEIFFDLIRFVNARMAHFAEYEAPCLDGERDGRDRDEIIDFSLEGANHREDLQIIETIGGTITETWMYSDLCGSMRVRRSELEYACTIIDPNGFEIGIEWMTDDERIDHIKTSRNDFTVTDMEPRERIGHTFESSLMIEGATDGCIKERPATEEEAELFRHERATVKSLLEGGAEVTFHK